jgi:predicted nucleic-acid-binding protein
VDVAVELFGKNKADFSDSARIALSHAAGTTPK